MKRHALLALPLFVLLLFGLAAFPHVPRASAANEAPSKKDEASPASPTPAAAAERPYGIEQRIPWTSSRITGSPEPPAPYRVEPAFPELKFTNPVELAHAPGTDRLLVVELGGKIWSFPNRSGATKPELFLDLSQIEGFRRAYGLTFHPQFEKNRYCYVSYVLDDGNPDGTHVSRFTVSQTDPPVADLASEQIVITWLSGGHNGASLQFGPEGYLYISSGDGGQSFPPDGRNAGQDISNLLASILRIDVDRSEAGRSYAIPSDNPFVNHEGARGEVWAYGLRNPWKMSFDPATGALWVGDVGWEMWEMIYRIERGGNYGWSLVEGRQPVHRERERGPTPIIPPTIEHSHIEARSITGGYVSWGERLKDLKGCYLYGDYVTGKIWAARLNGVEVTEVKELVDSPLEVVCFGVDAAGEVYIVDYGGGIYRLVPIPPAAVNRQFPTRLSETGLFAAVEKHELAPGLIPYSVNAEPWMDGATAERFFGLPGESTLDEYDIENVQKGYIKGAWKFPSDGVLVKTISLELEPGNAASRRRVETQLLHFDQDTWRAYTYRWNDEQTDAELVPAEGLDMRYAIHDPQAPGGQREQTWRFASRTECILCHTTRAGSIHSFNVPQLNRTHDYGKVADNQLRTLAHFGFFERPLPEKPGSMISPDDTAADLDARARAYLHVNCAHCHRRGGGGSAAFDIRVEYPLAKTNLLAGRPTQGTFGIYGAQTVAPGDPYRSVLFYRMAKLGRGRMPHFGSNVIDDAGLKLIHDWIVSLKSEAMASASAATADTATSDSIPALRARQHELVESLRSAEATANRAAAIDELLATTSGGLMLAYDLLQHDYADAVRKEIIAKGTGHADAQIRDLFERYVPEEQRVKRLGNVIDPAKILALAGNADRGRDIFFKGTGVQCRNCHKIQGNGGDLGPDLSEIGKKNSRAQLLESILEPSKTIEPKYAAYLVETQQGLVHSGLLVKKTDAEVVLKDAEGKETRIAAADIEYMAPQRVSFMPELLLRDMTAEEVADLLEFLAGLK